MERLERIVNGYYSSIVEKVRVKNEDPKIEVEKAFEAIYSEPGIERFNGAVRKLVSVIPFGKIVENEKEMAFAFADGGMEN
mgnify:CR=1 FL=1